MNIMTSFCINLATNLVCRCNRPSITQWKYILDKDFDN